MRIITLIPLTPTGKKIIKQYGSRWEVVKRQPYVRFDSTVGPSWLFIQALSEERAPANDMRSARVDSGARWVHEFNDIDFKVAP